MNEDKTKEIIIYETCRDISKNPSQTITRVPFCILQCETTISGSYIKTTMSVGKLTPRMLFLK